MKVPKMTAQASCCPVVRDFGTRTKASCPSRWAPDPVSCIVHRSELQCLKGCELKAYRSTLVYAKFVCERLTLEVFRSKGVSNLFVYPEPRFPRSVCLCKAYRKCVVDQGSSSAEKKVCRCVVCLFERQGQAREPGEPEPGRHYHHGFTNGSSPPPAAPTTRTTTTSQPPTNSVRRVRLAAIVTSPDANTTYVFDISDNDAVADLYDDFPEDVAVRAVRALSPHHGNPEPDADRWSSSWTPALMRE